ncbi:HAD family hydrolase [Tenacibaculum sp. M341]|nr:HAD family hydrolase [Tenacibaculum sp. M341]
MILSRYMKHTKVIVFDLYNTLVEIQKPTKFFLKLFKESRNGFNMDISSYLNLVMTKSVKELIRILPLEFEELYVENFSALTTEIASVEVYKEVLEVLSILSKDFELYLLSNLAEPYKKPVLATDLHLFFDHMIFSCDFGALKPSRTIFKEVEKISGKHSKEILMIGDSYKADIIGAQSMGWNTLMINRKKSNEDFDIQNLHELNELLKT